MAEKVIVVGSGPAGLTAAIYLARASLNPLCIEGFISGGVAGGQLMITTDVENFPGFPEGISGPELMERMKNQASKFGTRFVSEDVIDCDLTKTPFLLRTTSSTFEAETVIVATGATAKRLSLPSHGKFWNRGISACAVCDGGLPIFRNQVLAVVGGGDTAMEESLYLTHFASEVILIHRRDEFRASKAMQKRVLENPKIKVLYSTIVEDAIGDKSLSGLRIKNLKSGETKEIEVKGLFYAIGHTPNTNFLKGQIEIDDEGYIITKERTMTSIEGVFACGDVQDKIYRQAITAAGSGCMAGVDCERYLSGKD